MPTPAQIKKIHALKGKLTLDDPTYRHILGSYGVKTSTRLSITRADQLITELEEKAVAAGVWERREHSHSRRRLGSDPQAAKIVQLWAELHKAGKVRSGSVRSLSAYIKRMTGKDALNWCSTSEKSRLIEALKSWLYREPAPTVDIANGSVGAGSKPALLEPDQQQREGASE